MILPPAALLDRGRPSPFRAHTSLTANPTLRFFRTPQEILVQKFCHRSNGMESSNTQTTPLAGACMDAMDSSIVGICSFTIHMIWGTCFLLDSRPFQKAPEITTKCIISFTARSARNQKCCTNKPPDTLIPPSRSSAARRGKVPVESTK